MKSLSRINSVALTALFGTLAIMALNNGSAAPSDDGNSDMPQALLLTTPAGAASPEVLPDLAGYEDPKGPLQGLVGYNAPVPSHAPLALAANEAPASPGLALPAAEAPTVDPTSPAVRGQAALRLINFDLSSIGYTISFHPYAGTHLGMTFTQRRHIEVYVRPGVSDSRLAYATAHEMGHAVDHIRNTGQDRADWKVARDISASTPWWPTGVGSDLAIPAGDFAECFASFATGSPSHSVWGDCDPVMGLMQQLAHH